jgi:hypothetical protein
MGLQEGGRFVENDGALGVTCLFPALKAMISLGKRMLKLCVVQMLEALEKLAGVGVHALVGHGGTFFRVVYQLIGMSAAGRRSVFMR